MDMIKNSVAVVIPLEKFCLEDVKYAAYSSSCGSSYVSISPEWHGSGNLSTCERMFGGRYAWMFRSTSSRGTFAISFLK